MSTKKLTIYDVAKECGYSIAQVSKAMNNKRDVSPLTRDHILRAVKGLGFKPNTCATRVARTVPGLKTNIKDVAKLAGFSIATVSKCLNGYKWVSPDAAFRIKRAAEQLGYKANPIAVSLAAERKAA